MRAIHPAPRAAVYQVAYFPPAEYPAAWAHGLLNATSYRDHTDYRRETEQALRAMAERPAAGIRVVALEVPGLLAYAQRYVGRPRRGRHDGRHGGHRLRRRPARPVRAVDRHVRLLCGP
jgi:hypothetical protein